MTEPRRVNWNSLEKILSSDLNREASLANKAVMDQLIGMTAGLTAIPRDVVQRGFNATPGAGLSVNIGPGEMLHWDGTAGIDASKYKLAQLLLIQNLPITANVSGSPRVDVISALETSVPTDVTFRDLITTLTRVVVPSPVPKTITPGVQLTVTAGVPAATPAFPAAPGGEVPLWYVYVPDGAAAIDDNHLMDARVYWDPHSLENNLNVVERGLGVNQVLGSILIRNGAAYVNGTYTRVPADLIRTLASIIQDGEPAPAPDKIYDLYMISKGSGVPVGKNNPSVVLVATEIAQVPTAPTSDGRPNASIFFGPLADSPSPVPAATLKFSTPNALFLGSVVTNPSSLVVSGAPALTGDTSMGFAAAIEGSSGAFPASSGWLRRGRFSWVSATQVQLSLAHLVIDGSPMEQAPTTFDITTNLASNDPAEGGSTWYYAYLRRARGLGALFGYRGASRSVVPILSFEPPDLLGGKPTPEVGFASAEYLYVGSVFNDAAMDFVEFVREGQRVSYIVPSNSIVTAIAAVPARTPFVLRLPKSTRTAVVTVRTVLTAVGVPEDILVRVYNRTGLFLPNFIVPAQAVAGEIRSKTFGEGCVLVDAADTIELDRDVLAGGGSSLFALVGTHGYIEDPAGNA